MAENKIFITEILGDQFATELSQISNNNIISYQITTQKYSTNYFLN